MLFPEPIAPVRAIFKRGAPISIPQKFKGIGNIRPERRGEFQPLPPYGNPERAVTVHAAVNPAGRAAITGVRVNNELYKEPIL